MTKIILIISLLFSVVVAKDMDPKKLESSCDNGDIDACFYLGALYSDGKGVRQNHQKATELFKKACDGGISLACGFLGFLYSDGKGVKQNYQKEAELYQKSCDGGIIPA